MEEDESTEPVYKAEQTVRRSLVIKADRGEVTSQRDNLGDPQAGEEDLINCLASHDIQESQYMSLRSSGTSYWCVSESADTPLLLSPVTGPSIKEPPPVKPNLGRDHRRYYHEYWRSEYLMDFDRQRHGMICMVCGSSLATLKLSTIKRHIRQKHPYSLLWSESDKEVIRSGWESHLRLENSQISICSDPENTLGSEELPDVEMQPTGKPGGAVTPTSLSPSVRELPSPTAEVLERYLNDSLHAWFRQEFLMEYQAEAGRLVCMVCNCLLTSLHLDHIKSHVLNLHPKSLLFTAEEKHTILQTWGKTHDSEFLQDMKLQKHTKDENINGLAQLFTLDVDPIQKNLGNYSRQDESPPDTDRRAQSSPKSFTRKGRLKFGSPWRLRLDYLVAYGPPDNPCCYCMVCSMHLPVPRVSNFRKHIQACHPDTSSLNRNDKDAVIRAWTEKENKDSVNDLQSRTPSVNTGINAQDSSVKITEQGRTKTKEYKSTNITPSIQTTGRNRHYLGKDQRRNYQARWRMDFLMDYDCIRHGLICMVCGATLATLKVSTIKRHVLQLHPHSLEYSPEEKQLVLQSYSHTSLHFHSYDCFLGPNHSHKENANGSSIQTLNQAT